MKKLLLYILALLLNVSFFGCTSIVNGTQTQKADQYKNVPQKSSKLDEDAIINLVKDFGSKLQLVSLQAPQDVVKRSMQENYGDYVSQELLSEWISKPLSAPGRLTSSPWPDRIEIFSVEKLSEYEYKVNGGIIEITSVEKANGGIAAKRLVTLKIKKTDNRWLINDIVLDAYEETNSIVYKNTQYGFSFSLPESWKDYKIVTDKWEGLSFGSSQGEEIVEAGPVISIRHPLWTDKNPRQDIPIMLFTLTQ